MRTTLTGTIRGKTIELAEEQGFPDGQQVTVTVQAATSPTSMSASSITKTPGVCGGDACIQGHRIPIWVLDGYRRLGRSDADLLRDYPSLTSREQQAAWKYADSNTEEIDRAIQENEEGEDGTVE